MLTQSRSISLLGLVFIVLAFPALAAADAIGITVLQSNYSIDLSATLFTLGGGVTPPPVLAEGARTTTGQSPISDSLTVSTANSVATATASAGLFSTVAHTTSDASARALENPVSFATVAEQVTFLTGSSVTGDIGFGLTGPIVFTRGFFQLNDLTGNGVLWNYAWDTTNGNGISTVPGFNVAAQLLEWSTATSFIADHVYRLDMSTFTNSNRDVETIGATVTGLEPVPEPTTLMLLALGGGGLLYRHRGRHKK